MGKKIKTEKKKIAKKSMRKKTQNYRSKKKISIITGSINYNKSPIKIYIG
jgi:hypothetical protein